MTLEDFFTLTEMKGGFTVPSRVEELVTVMWKEKDCALQNVGDATRQWAAVASTIAATENKDCLDLFIQLDGLWFIDRWLKEAQKFNKDTNGSFVEESIVDLLRALEKLHVSNEKAVSSGIWITVKSLLGNSSSRVQDRARVVFDSWKPGLDGDAVNLDVDSVRVALDEGNAKLAAEISQQDASTTPISEKGTNKENSVSGTPISENSQPKEIEDLKRQNVRVEEGSEMISVHSDVNDGSPDPMHSAVVSEPLLGNITISKETVASFPEGITTAAPKQGSNKEHSEDSQSNELPKNDKQMDKVLTEISSISCVLEPEADTSAVDGKAKETVKEPVLRNNDDGNVVGISHNVSLLHSERFPTLSDFKSRMDEIGLAKCSLTQPSKTAVQDGECHPKVLQDASKNESKDFVTSISKMDEIGAPDDELSSDDSDYVTTISGILKPKFKSKRSNINEKRSDMELEFGIDALDVARRVAQEVEREVVDQREPFCSSSSDKIGQPHGIGRPRSPDSINGKRDEQIDVRPKKLRASRSHSFETDSDSDAGSTDPYNVNTEPSNSQSAGCSQVNEADQGAEAKTEKGPSAFDLNEEVCSDEIDCISNPVPTSITAKAPRLAPQQLEESAGRKGSAATSAFHEVSHRTNPYGDKIISSAENSDSSKQRHHFIDIDLNVAKSGDESGKQVLSSSFPSGKSLGESSSKRSGGLNLDLNSTGDDGDTQVSDMRMEGQLPHSRTSHCSPSASSSSSMQPFMRNIDLNDSPYVQSNHSEKVLLTSSQDFSVYGEPKPDASFISIMGTRVQVNKKDFVLRTPSFPNGRAIEPVMDANMARARVVSGISSAMSFTQAPFFGYNGLTSAPTMSFSSTMYGPNGPIPYMVDARGATVVPQILGPASTIPPSSYSHPPFMMSIAGPQRPNFDLNSALMIEGGGNRDPSGGLRQFFLPAGGRPMEEQLRLNSQVPNTGKRKEPEGGWDVYPLGYKHGQPWKQ